VHRLNFASPIDQRGARGYTLPSRSDGARVFRRAIRHSRRVRFVRLAIPFCAVTALVLSALAASLNPLGVLAGLPVDFGGLVVSGTKVTMQAPRVVGFTKDGRPYELTAHAAAQDVMNPDTIELQQLHGTSEMPDKAVFELRSDAGTYASKAEMLYLRQNVVLKSSAGLQVFLSEATVDLHSSNVASEKPVEVRMPNGIINASRMYVTESGDSIHFDGGVTMTTSMGSGAHAMHLDGRMAP
jgi:lipopolysaccharide export system protein LptC